MTSDQAQETPPSLALVEPVVTEVGIRRRGEIGAWAEQLLAAGLPDDDAVLFWLTWALHRHMRSGNRVAFEELVAEYGHEEHPLVQSCRWYLYEDGERILAAGPDAVAWLRARGDHHAADLVEMETVGSGLMTTARWDDAVEQSEHWIERFASAGPPTFLYNSLGFLGYTLQLRGDVDAARVRFVAAGDVPTSLAAEADDEGTVLGGPNPKRSGFTTDRLEAFSDGVFAIAITLLVLDLSLPEVWLDDPLTAFLGLWPSYLAYVVSFATIGAAWLAHTAVTNRVARGDTTFARLNLLLLLVVSFLTFPTSMVGEAVRAEDAERVATTIFGLNLFLVAVIIALLWRHARRHGLVRDDVADDEVAVLTQRLTPSLWGYLAMIVVGLFLPVVAVMGYLAIGLVLLFPVRRHN